MSDIRRGRTKHWAADLGTNVTGAGVKVEARSDAPGEWHMRIDVAGPVGFSPEVTADLFAFMKTVDEEANDYEREP